MKAHSPRERARLAAIRVSLGRQDFRLMIVSKLTRLETLLEDLAGNGQPGRIQRIEERLRAHDRWLWTSAGAGLVAGWLLNRVLG
jgi:hypothetical protein